MNAYLKNILFGFMVAMSCSMYGQGSVGIGTEMPDASALLDLVATDKGVLVPRLTTAQRSGIITPADGLLVYDSDTKSFWYFDSTLTIWTELRSGIIKSLVDADGDTKIQVEKIADEDIIRFDLAGSEKMVLIQNTSGQPRLELGTGLNLAVGDDALLLNDPENGIYNTAIGNLALDANTTGHNNTGIGYSALSANTTGNGNTANGIAALRSNTTGNFNTSIGFGSLNSNTEGVYNTANGTQSLYFNSTGDYNTANGWDALFSNTTGNSNTANGVKALYSNKANSRSTAIGYESMKYADDRTNGRETFNTAVGYGTLRGDDRSNNSGQYNTAIGDQALFFNNVGNSNTSSGVSALYFNTTGNYNTANGVHSLYQNRANSRSTAIGYAAMYNAHNTTTGDSTYNTAVGAEALRGSSSPSSNTGKYNTVLGDAALFSNTSGSRNIATGVQALYSNTSGSGNIAIGNDALRSNTTQSGLVAIGDSSLYANDGGNDNTAVGFKSLHNNTGGYSNTANGNQSLYSNTMGFHNIAIGYKSLYRNTNGSGNSALGSQALLSNTIGNGNTAIGATALSQNNVGNYNTAVGSGALISNNSGINNSANGVDVLWTNTSGSFNTSSGYKSLYSNTTGNYNTANGLNTLYNNKANSRSTAIGYGAMYNADNTMTGDSTYNTAVGAEALRGSGTPSNNTGKYNTALGDAALYSNTSGSRNIATGVQAAYSNTSGSGNIAIGNSALHNNTTQSGLVAIGDSSMYANTGAYNTAIGSKALINNTSGTNNTAIGYYADVTSGNLSNATAIGFNAKVSTSNSMILGGTGTEAVRVGIGTATPANSAALDVTSTSKGFLPPRMTKTQMEEIPNPAEGLTVYCTNCRYKGIFFYSGAVWVGMSDNLPHDISPTDVYNPVTGKVWMDRNLGASQVATSSTDALAYGDLYQWGRATDGHQLRTSGTISILSGTDTPGHDNFIAAPAYPNDWRSPQNTNLWQGINGINNPCPSGYRLPTETEFNEERLSWDDNNSVGAFNSQLKLPTGGYRVYDNLVFGSGHYWTSNVYLHFSKGLQFGPTNAGIYIIYPRSNGASVRCIKDSGTIGTIENLNCGNASIIGSLVENSPANGISAVVGYSGGNGLFHNGQIVSSTGVSGLTATLSAGNFSVGSGTLTYLITGTPASSGNANFALNIGGTSCSLIIPVEADVYPPGTVHCNPNNHTLVVEVLNPVTGEIWMDRNLGASRVATSSTDALAYGDLYQWGRRADGHQCRTSATTPILSGTNTPNHDDFILAPDPPYDWRSPQNDNLWQGISGINNPCPEGFRIPTEAELNAEKASWGSNDAAGAFASPLKFTLAGQRSDSNGSINDEGTFGRYWSSNIDGTRSRNLYFGSTFAFLFSDNRAYGYCIRCIKE